MSAKSDFIFELGCEELPHGFIDAAREQLKNKVQQYVDEQKLSYTNLRAFSTPRRLAVFIEDLQSEQSDQHEIKKGPPLKAAFKDGEWTGAGKGFMGRVVDAKKMPKAPEDLKLIEDEASEDGVYRKDFGGQEFLCTYRFIAGKKTATLLESALPEIVTNMHFPKSMRWGDLDFSFARPVRWFLALLGEEVIPFELARLKSGRLTYGHPQFFPRSQSVDLAKAGDYLSTLREVKVLADHEERLASILEQCQTIEKDKDVLLVQKERVARLVNNLVEYPKVILTPFDEAFLELPSEVLISEMVEHQMYFPVKAKDGKLAAYFGITSNIAKAENVAKGNLKVLASRLRDGKFLYEEDKKRGLEAMGEGLKSVVYTKTLGTVQDKVERTLSLALSLQKKCGLSSEKQVSESVRLMKNDLNSNMVYEFPELQGVMGRYYALSEGRDAEVAEAIAEHYMPLGSGSDLPASETGAVASLAEKFENLFGCFATDMIPTGSNDPYALRRQAFGLLRILQQYKIPLNFREFIEENFSTYAGFVANSKKINDQKSFSESLLKFFEGRLKSLLKESGARGDEIEAVIQAGWEPIYSVFERLEAIKMHKNDDNFLSFVQLSKRIRHILDKNNRNTEIDSKLFETEAEKSLFVLLEKESEDLQKLKKSGQYTEFFQAIQKFSLPLDKLFNDVMILAEDKNVRNNRLALLGKVQDLSDGLLDFDALSA